MDGEVWFVGANSTPRFAALREATRASGANAEIFFEEEAGLASNLGC